MKGIDFPPKTSEPEEEKDTTLDALEDAMIRNSELEVERSQAMARAGDAYDKEQARAARLHKKTAARHDAEIESARERIASGVKEQKITEGVEKLRAGSRARDTKRIEEVRARLSALEKAASTKDVEAEAVALEDELRGIESKRAAKEKKPEAFGISAVYEGDAHFGMPVVVADTHLEKKQVLYDVLKEVPVLEITEPPLEKPVIAATERAAVQQSEKTYLEALKSFEKKKTFWNRITKSDELREEGKRLETLKSAYDKARVTYGNALTSSAAERLTAKGGSESRNERVLDRYNRLVRFNEVLKPAAEKRLAARAEALDARGRNVFEKALGWSAKQNLKLEKTFGKNGARAIRAALGATIGTAAIASFGTMGAAALIGFGTFRFTRALAASIGGSIAGETVGELAEKVFFRSQKETAEKKLKTAGKNPSGKVELTLGDLEKTDKTREKLLKQADEMNLQKKKVLVKTFVALGVGAGTAAALSELHALQNAVDVVAPKAEGDVPGTETKPRGITVVEKPGVETPAETPSGAVPALEAWSTTIDRSGEGVNNLFGDLREHYAAIYPNAADAPPAIRHILETESNSELSREFGFIDKNTGESLVVQKGASLSVDAEGHIVFKADAASVPHTLVAGESLVERPAPGIVGQEVPTVATEGNVYAQVVEDPGPLTYGPPGVTIDTGLEGAPESAAPTAVPTEVAPVAKPPVPESVDTHTEPAPVSETVSEVKASSEAFTNKWNVPVDPKIPAIYEHTYPGIKTPFTVAYGGTFEERFATAKTFATEHPGVRVLFDASYKDEVTGKMVPTVGAFEFDKATGSMNVIPGSMTDPAGYPLKLPTAENLIKKIT